MYLRHACAAAWNCGELGSTLPLNVTPSNVRLPPTPLPNDAAKPCDVKQVARATLFGVVAALDVAVVASLATEGAELPPQPATAARPASVTARPGARPSIHRTLTTPSKTDMKLG